MVCIAVEDAPAVHVYDGDHVGGVLADQTEKFFALRQAIAHAMYLQLLKDGVDVKDQNQGDQALHDWGKKVK